MTDQPKDQTPPAEPPSFDDKGLAVQFRQLQRDVAEHLKANAGEIELTTVQLEAIGKVIDERFRIAGRRLAEDLATLQKGHERVWGKTDWSTDPDESASNQPKPD